MLGHVLRTGPARTPVGGYPRPLRGTPCPLRYIPDLSTIVAGRAVPRTPNGARPAPCGPFPTSAPSWPVAQFPAPLTGHALPLTVHSRPQHRRGSSRSSPRAAYDYGYHVVLATDAMSEPDTEAHRHNIERIFPKTGETATTAEITDMVEGTR